MKNRYLVLCTAILLLTGAAGVARAQSAFTWNGGGTTDNFSDTGNWGGENGNQHGILQFDGETRLTPFADGAETFNTHRLFFLEDAESFVISGREITLNDHGGVDPAIRNLSANVQTIMNNLRGDSTALNDPLRVEAMNGDIVLMGAITNRGSALVISNAASDRYVALGGVITGIRNVEVSAGQLRLLETADFSTMSGSNFVGNGGTINVAASLLLADMDGGYVFNNEIRINQGNGTSGSRVIGGLNTSGTNTFHGNIIRGTTGNRTITLSAAAGGTVDFNGSITGAHGVIISGPGMVRFGGNNNYAASTSIESGQLHVREGSSIGAAGQSVLLGSGATPSVSAGVFIADGDGGTAMNRDITVNAGENFNRTIGGLNTSGVNTFGGNVAMDGADRGATLYANEGGTVAFDGGFSGAGGIRTTGDGTIRLNAANTYSGNTIVASGVLQLGAGGSISNTPVIDVQSGATFDVGNSGFNLRSGQTLTGGGTVSGELVLKADAVLAPGTSPGQMTFTADLTLESGAIVEIEIGGYDAGDDYDQIVMANGSLFNNQGASLNVSFLYGFENSVAFGSQFILLSGSHSGTFMGLNDGDTITSSGVDMMISYNDGTDITLTVVPEPSSLLLVLFGVAALRTVRRRREC